MIAPATFLLLSSLLSQVYAIPTNLTNGTEVIEVQSNISDFLEGAIEVDGGDLGDLIPIPELVNLTLVDKDEELIYDIPEEGLDISEELYEALTGEKPKHVKPRFTTTNWNKFYGNLRSMSSPLCGPGTISKTYTASYSWQVSGSIDPSVKLDAGFLEKLGVKVGFAYTWGNAVATGYTATCSELHPCVATFKPWIGIVKGRGRWTELSNAGNKLCRSGYGGNLEVKLPIVRDCPSGSKECGADGVWDKCHFVGNFAKACCSNLGPTPAAGSLCPASLCPN
ncbi:hypothetical protein GTA08_BOTSDO01808 [Botryosphaeria dothidea]|uniref:Uncharacterized protein n=1 Tax=Botryosphaeria dothidea TaxID=55169 RepID=A0A8H4IX88_9PEZI|nr:hypothetical protein GTA08_BOTSDO01808 [Botryosphaeria dothidea]